MIMFRVASARTVAAASAWTLVAWNNLGMHCMDADYGVFSLGGGGANPNRAPVVSDASASTTVNAPVAIALSARDADGNPLALRIVVQPSHATVGLSGVQATYYPEAVFLGAASFTFAARDGSTDSNRGALSVSVEPGPTPTPRSCAADCNDSHRVTVVELVTMVNIALGNTPVTSCEAGDMNGDGYIRVNEIVAAVTVALSACAAGV